ncbi:Dabb family protein [Microbacterium testaceum]|uniref:Dabb family protein n=1 Tax=Microbacterium testaceum TaxID=2033 RepID=UPI0025B1C559|nr:Dabb family protein [Microbacterium testaceum]WJS89627.1 Dabb family protein [Microbacterium testaceum]
MFRHIVLFRVRDDVTDPDVSAAIDELRAAGNAPEVTAWTVVPSLDTRKGRIIVQDGTFGDRCAFETWRAGETHRQVARRMAGMADWWVGDWSTDVP